MDNTAEQVLLEEEANSDDFMKRTWAESKKIWRIAFPGTLSRVCSYGIMVVTQSFIGHVSKTDLAAFALVQSFLVQFINGILLGMSSATETLCGQAFGAKQYHNLGVYLQRSWIIGFTTTTIFIPLLIFATSIFKLIGEEEKIAVAAGNLSMWFIPLSYNFVFVYTIQMYLQAQLKNMIIGWISVFSFVFHVILSWIFVNKLALGVHGAMGAMVISSLLIVFAEFVYIFGGWCPLTWRGFTKAAFFDMIPLVKLSISSGVMLCLELWYFSILIILAGYMKNAEVAISAFSVGLNIGAWEFMIFLGFLGAACVRVSNELGAGNAKAAEFSIKVILSTSSCMGVFFCILTLILGGKIAYFFTDSEEVAKSVSSIYILLAFSMLLNSIQPVLSGVAVGAGFQSIVAKVNLCCYYIIGIPLGILLGYVANLQIQGIWIGQICGVLIQTLVLSFITWRTDWNHQVSKASERLNRWLLNPSEEFDQSSNSNLI